MGELIRRLRERPNLTAEVLAASLFANILALASPLFTIQVLNRYVGQGVDPTLATLATGVLLAIALEFGFCQARLKLARGLSAAKDRDLATGAFGILTTADIAALSKVPAGERRELLRGLDMIENAYSPANIAAVIDVPFALLFAAALFLLSPHLAGITVLFLIGIFLFAVSAQRALRGPTQMLNGQTNETAGILNNANTAVEAVRAFGAREILFNAWNVVGGRTRTLRAMIAKRQASVQSITQSAQAVMSVFIYSVGAYLVVRGDLDVGVLIGANILSARALGPIVKFAQMGEGFAKAETALAKIREFAHMPVEPERGTRLSAFNGQLELRNVGFSYPGAKVPLYEGLNFKLPPGAVLVVTGKNGTGKTTLAKIAVGLLKPDQGQVLADGVELGQFDPSWCRRQVMFLPQEPTFLNASIRANLQAATPDGSEETMMRIVREVGLGRFIDESQEGIETILQSGGSNLALRLRRRLAFARALFVGGKLAILDEPTEGMDGEGTAFVYSALIDMARRGKTIVAFSRDPQILRAASLVLDLDSKPVPVLRQSAPTPAPAAAPAPAPASAPAPAGVADGGA